jgi:FkbH-like protein
MREPTSASQFGPTKESLPPSPGVVLAATFTADPLVDSLSLLLREAGVALPVEVAPYGQALQQLLDPTGYFARNRAGVNVVLLRLEDWLRKADGTIDLQTVRGGAIERNIAELAAAVRSAASAMLVPLVLSVCPPSALVSANSEARTYFQLVQDKLRADLAAVPGVRFLSTGGFDSWPPSVLHDLEGDRLGHVPYTPRFFAGLGWELARLIYGLKCPPAKAIVLDGDNTLWNGIVGEDGVSGIQIPERFSRLQRFMLEKKREGMILCLASKNVEADVLEVFRRRQDMVLREGDIVAMRVNWQPKSENIRAMAEKLNLGLDSFVFVDDNPLECAEVESACPDVLVLQVRTDEDPTTLMRNVWPLDVLSVTEEDRRRSEMYRENLARERFVKTSGSLADFLAGLELTVTCHAPAQEQLARVAQLTQRTNQFNFTTRRRTETEVEQLARQGKECLVVEVRDRFGDYGLVGVVVFQAESDRLVVDTFLLSCRVLGRGVEHAMVREIGNRAKALGLSQIEMSFLPTKKNLPARQFLDSLDPHLREVTSDGTKVVLLTESASKVAYTPADGSPELTVVDQPKASQLQTSAGSKSERWNRFARTLDTPEKVLAALQRNSRRARGCKKAAIPPRTPTERKLCAIWAEVLGIPAIGVNDDYLSDLGGTSLLAVTIFARTERELGVHLPLAALVETPTVAGIATRIDQPRDLKSLVALRESGPGIPLFLVHDADGETFLYRNLARRLGDRPVYGIQPHVRPDTPIMHTRIPDMAAHYVAEIRKVRPHGPYWLGGLCAGGVVAYEMALQLEKAGEVARLVAIFDAADVEAARKPNLDNSRRMGRLRQVFDQGSFGQVLCAVAVKTGGYVAHKIRSKIEHARDRAAVATLRFCLGRGLALPRWARDLAVRRVYNVAEAKYRPTRPVSNEIVLFRATEGEGSDEPYVRLYADPLLGWGRRSQRGVRVFDVQGGHGSMLQEPYVARLADILRSYLADLGSHPTSVSAAGGRAR